IDLMMPVWTPGFYRVEDYAARVQDLAARTPDGAALKAERVKRNRWRLPTGGAATVLVTYKLLCKGRSVTGNWVGADLLVLNGGGAVVPRVGKARRPDGGRPGPPPGGERSVAGLGAAAGGRPHHDPAAGPQTL